jgi:hypothetical protein
METKQTEKSAKNETSLEKSELNEIDLASSPFCQSNCKVCSSPYFEEIQQMIKDGHTYRDISNHFKENFGYSLSPSSISRHQKNYRKALRSLATKLSREKFDAQAETLARHQHDTLFLIRASYQQILDHLASGTLRLGIDDFKELVKLYYNVIRDPDSADDSDVLALFQKASEKQGFDIQQGVLFKPKKPSSD